ncbi:hypothetical protein BG004_004869 [Podila humilis]|nr:hypothetical protein BG004_004869 [Podila humilis]
MKPRLSTLDIACMTICMLGVQFTWTVELGYGTPYLLSLGIPKTMTALVWLAGPLSGLVIQPLVGVFSDTLDWNIGRRRPFILIGALLTVVSMYMVAYAKEIARWIVATLLAKEGDSVDSSVKAWTIGLAVVGFYSLDFSINAVQASCRSLIMDIPKADQQEICNAWSGWMNNLGSVAGFFAGNLDLVKHVPFLGDAQIKALANLAIIFFSTGLGICCLSVKEIPYQPTIEDESKYVEGNLPEILNRPRDDTYNNLRHILQPPPTTPSDPEGAAERAGSFALLCWAGLAVIAGISLPHITPQELGLDRWPQNPFTLKNLWTMSLVWFASCMGLTWFVDDIWAATVVIALCGVPWAVALWVPFAMVGEIISVRNDRLVDTQSSGTLVTTSEVNLPGSSAVPTTTDYGTMGDDFTGLLQESSTLSSDRDALTSPEPESDILDAEMQGLNGRNGEPHLDAGLVLGVHNMYIVFPQFIDALVASSLFAMIGSAPPQPPHGPPSSDPFLPNPARPMYSVAPEPVGWVLRFGGLMALVAAYLTRKL